MGRPLCCRLPAGPQRRLTSCDTPLSPPLLLLLLLLLLLPPPLVHAFRRVCRGARPSDGPCVYRASEPGGAALPRHNFLRVQPPRLRHGRQTPVAFCYEILMNTADIFKQTRLWRCLDGSSATAGLRSPQLLEEDGGPGAERCLVPGRPLGVLPTTVRRGHTQLICKQPHTRSQADAWQTGRHRQTDRRRMAEYLDSSTVISGQTRGEYFV